jgi:hypothetical protein
MRPTTRRFLAAMLLTAAAGLALSQQASAQPAPPAPDVAAPAAELPQLPVVVAPAPKPGAPAVDPALTSDVQAPVAAKLAIPEPAVETGSRSTMILGEWMLAGVLIVALFSITQLLRRRQSKRASMADLVALGAELKPAPATPRRSYGSRVSRA